VPGFSAWSEKEGEIFVQAPAGFLGRLLAVRVHLDPCHEEDGPLHVVPGSHALGILTPKESMEARAELGSKACIAGVGDALVMRPLVLHASSKASGASLRRVLHFVFGPRELPHGVRWQHAV
jgi:ectoine hydroxylase-related dioxygenase (phytanoyl-CoA dioxygenase family)